MRRLGPVLYLAVGCAAIAAYFAAGRGSALGHILLYDSIGASAVGVMLVGVRSHRPERLHAWVGLAAGQALFVAGDVIWTSYDLAGSSTSFPSVADGIYLCAYPVLTWGLVRLARGGDRRRSLSALIDAAVIAVAVGLAIWPFTLEPLLEADGTVLAHVVSLTYPVWDLVLVGATARLVLVGRRGPAVGLLLASMLSLFLGDLAYGTPAASGSYVLGGANDAGWLLSYVLIGAAALAPSMIRVRPARPLGMQVTARRWLVCALALLAFPLSLVGDYKSDGTIDDVYVFAVVGVALTVLVVARIAMLTGDVDRMRAEVEATARKFRLVFESAPIGISLGNGGIMSETNPAFQRMLGYTGEELAQMHFSEVTHVEDETALQAELESGLRDSFAIEKRYVRRDGTLVPVVAHIARAADDSFGIGLIEDITERRQLEDELRHSQKMDAVGKLAGGIAHDFNNLMTAVIGYSDILLGELADDPQRAERAGEIKKAAERASDLTRQLLAFSRKQMLRVSRLDLRDVALEMESLLSRVLGEHVVLDVRPGADEVPVMADRSQLEQVLMNLAVNARDAMPGGGRLSIAIARDGDDAVLTVVDTGAGMTPGVREQIFEPFFSTKHPTEATGLGLSTVYGIVAQSGGTIEVLSVPDAGSTFVVRLPLASEAAVDGGEEPVGARVPDADEHGEEQTSRGRKHPAREAVQAHDRHLRDVRAKECAA
jgi:PAS domain S-box-containing protein